MKKILSLFAAVLFAGSMFATTVSKTVEELATANSWENGTVVTPFALDEVITVSTEATDANTGKYYTNGQQVRLYQKGEAAIIITAAEGASISSVTLTYVSEKTGILSEAESGVAIAFDNVQSAAFHVVNSDPSIDNGQVRITAFEVVYSDGGVTPPEPETIPSTAPAAPAKDEADVMAVFCNHYAENNANFGISGWAGAYQILDIEDTKIAYWEGMTWECIIDPVNTDDAHDFSSYKNIHIDMWAPEAAKIKLTAEAVAGGDYKDGVVVELKRGWNSVNIAVADWTGNYDFANLKCFVLEQYKTPADESFEGHPFAFANLYFFGKKAAPLPDPTNCAEAAEAALSVEKNKDLYNDGKEYTIRGFVTAIETEFSEQYGNISFWMADDVNGGNVLQAFRCVPEAADKLPEVGDLVEVTGQLTKYNDIPEFAQGCTCVIIQKQGVENTAATVKAVKVIRDGQVIILKGDKTFNVLGTEMK